MAILFPAYPGFVVVAACAPPKPHKQRSREGGKLVNDSLTENVSGGDRQPSRSKNPSGNLHFFEGFGRL
jgi:hypothetical protein